MAEVFLGAFVNVLVDRLASSDLWNFARKERIDTQLKKWSSTLEQVQAVVADAEEKQITDRETKLWLSDLEDLSYDMDDVLDEFATEALRRKMAKEPRASTSKVRKLMPNCSTSFNPRTLVSDFRMRPKMDKITARLQDLFNRRMGLGLKNIAAGGSGKASQRQPTSPLIIEPCLYGTDNDKQAIIELLMSDQSGSNKVGVVPIVGMGGVGKATLAQMVYNDEMVDEHFEMKAWIYSLQEMPPKIGKLTSLQTLSNFIVGNGNGSMITELGSLIHLRGTLSISGLENVTDASDARRANLKDKQGLIVLRMEWSNISDNSHNENAESQVLDMLEPHKKLKELSISGYGGLTFPTWVGNSLFSNMVYLKFQNCEKCTSLPPLGQLPSLAKLYIQELCISRCPRLISFPVLPSTLKELQIRDCDALVSLPDLTLLNNLEKLFLYAFPSLPYLSSGSGLPPALKELTVRRCAELKSLIAEEGIKINCPSLEYIKILECERLKTLPDVMQNNNGLKNLSRLKINWCGNLESLPEGWFPTTNFREFSICTCEKLEPLPNRAYNNNRLASVEQQFVRGFPTGTGLLSHIMDEGSSSYFTNFTSLSIKNVDIGKRGLHRLYSLRKLSLWDCDWVSFPEDGMLLLPSSLVNLDIQRFPNLEKLSFKDFENLVSLKILHIWDCPKLTSISEVRLPPLLLDLSISDCTNLASFPEQGLPPSLLGLLISGCPKLTSFPEQRLPPSLSCLWIIDCPNLASFPEQGLPPSLLLLWISNCPVLKRRFEKRKGQYWRFIAHIPQVMIEGKFVFDPAWRRGSGGIHGKAADAVANIWKRSNRTSPRMILESSGMM
ncbi:hypothetical protein RHMOL_Rhmol01G0050900 [Rhododendron molle]|uniref:Uncharacterized protein n=1 Tax=Rhododendron molle TaxID=49168 RepID=A0ACC0PZN7_RHOML|nr:hypothetical protein RHMOL_Rhmol01G0050900 [Rhododendron molle]